MIIVKLIGGLGNQMFQYAFGRNLSVKHNVELKLDITGLSVENIPDFTKRDFGLNAFSINAQVATDQEISLFAKSRAGKIKDFVSLSLPVKSSNFYLREPHFHFYAKALNAPSNSYVDGYWHSEKYFRNIRSVLLQEFSLKNKSKEISELASHINTENAISLHVRRGDYLNAINSKIYANCDMNYYGAAMKMLAEKIQDPVFYIFSDDHEWFEKNYNLQFRYHIVNEKGENRNFEDLYLMSMCKHHIVANSSFSWWGAWLGRNENKSVIAPVKWFIDDSRNTKDLLPDNWIKL